MSPSPDVSGVHGHISSTHCIQLLSDATDLSKLQSASQNDKHWRMENTTQKLIRSETRLAPRKTTGRHVSFSLGQVYNGATPPHSQHHPRQLVGQTVLSSGRQSACRLHRHPVETCSLRPGLHARGTTQDAPANVHRARTLFFPKNRVIVQELRNATLGAANVAQKIKVGSKEQFFSFFEKV